MASSRCKSRSNLKALDIIDFETRCRRTFFLCSSAMQTTFVLLESSAREYKRFADTIGFDFDADTSNFLKEMAATFVFETPFQDILASSRTLEYNQKFYNLKILPAFKHNLFNDYIRWLKYMFRTGLDVNNIEEILEKFLRVHQVLRLSSEHSSSEMFQYEFMAELLRICHEVRIQNSKLVVSLVKMTVDRQEIEGRTLRSARQPMFSDGFFSYILQHSFSQRFEIVRYCLARPRTLWDYSRNFHIVHVAAFGYVNRLTLLLQYGFDSFPEADAAMSGHTVSGLDEILPRSHLLTLHLMSKFKQVDNRTALPFLRDILFPTEAQKQCFRLIWRCIPDPHIRLTKLRLSAAKEYLFLARHAVIIPNRINENIKLALTYEYCFPDLTCGPSGPRSLKHLCRCAIRARLRDNWYLPDGVKSFDLPLSLQDYINLKCD